MENQNANTPVDIRAFVAVDQTQDREHAKHSPSSWKNKLICPGWRGMPGGDAAKRGSLGHKAVEENNPDLCGEDAELRAAVIKVLDFKRGFLKKFESLVPADVTTILREEKLQILDQFGYFDEVWFRGSQAVMLDYKFAVNEYTADSPQFWGYCIGLWDKHPQLQQIRVVVLLPFRDEIDEEVFDRATHYEKFVVTGKSIIVNAENDDPATYKTNAGCAYCKRAGQCPKLTQIAISVANEIYPDKVALPAVLDPVLIKDARTMGKVLALSKMLGDDKTGWCARVAARAKEMALDEGIVPEGYKLQQAAAPRRVTNVRAAYEAVKDKVGLDEFLGITAIKIGDLETVFSEVAPKGEKGKYKSELDVRLRDIEALEQGDPVWRLVPERK